MKNKPVKIDNSSIIKQAEKIHKEFSTAINEKNLSNAEILVLISELPKRIENLEKEVSLLKKELNNIKKNK